MESVVDKANITEKYMALYDQAVALFERMEQEHSHSVNVNGIALSYLDCGPSEGTPLIWVPGSGGTRYELSMVHEGLIKAGYRVIAIDPRGHGNTQIEITKYNTSLYHIADDVAALMDYLDIEKAIMGGLSKGGWIAAAFYDTYPERVLGLLLEDGGSFSGLRLAEDTASGVIQPAPAPYPAEACEALFQGRFHNRKDALKAVWEAYFVTMLPERQLNLTVEDITCMLSFFRQEDDGAWVHHCDIPALMLYEGSLDKEVSDLKLYTRLPMMQQSQELMIPSVIFRNLHVPMHIIDPDSPTDWLPVRYQNEELQQLHPDLIVHEVYEYEHSSHGAHYERPERFIESAKALLARVRVHTNAG